MADNYIYFTNSTAAIFSMLFKFESGVKEILSILCSNKNCAYSGQSLGVSSQGPIFTHKLMQHEYFLID